MWFALRNRKVNRWYGMHQKMFTVSGWGRLGSSALPAFSPFSKKAEGIMWKKQNIVWCCLLLTILRFLFFQGFTNSVLAKLRAFFCLFPFPHQRSSLKVLRVLHCGTFFPPNAAWNTSTQNERSKGPGVANQSRFLMIPYWGQKESYRFSLDPCTSGR